MFFTMFLIKRVLITPKPGGQQRGPEGLTCSFQQMNKRALFVVPSLYQKGVSPRWKRCDSKNPLSAWPQFPVIRNSNKKHGSSGNDISKHAIESSHEFMNLKNNIHRPYLLVKSFDVSFLVN